jgi:cytoskeleton protein RodZ
VASFGENLRRAREARKITLQEIASSTKISTRNLQALEEERFDFLPGGVFNKGFVRAYASYVGLDVKKTLAAYMEANPDPVEPDIQEISRQMAAAPKGRRSGISPATMVTVIAALVALLLSGLWFREQRRETAAEAALRQPPQISAAPAGIPATAPATPTPEPAAPVAGAEQAAPATPGSQPPATSSAAQPAMSTTNIDPSAPVRLATPAISGHGAAPVEVSIQAHERSWISVRKDGEVFETLTLDPQIPAQSQRVYKAQERITVTAGNPAGLDVTYNGKPAGSLGDEGKRATISFTPDGMEKR